MGSQRHAGRGQFRLQAANDLPLTRARGGGVLADDAQVDGRDGDVLAPRHGAQMFLEAQGAVEGIARVVGDRRKRLVGHCRDRLLVGEQACGMTGALILRAIVATHAAMARTFSSCKASCSVRTARLRSF